MCNKCESTGIFPEAAYGVIVEAPHFTLSYHCEGWWKAQRTVALALELLDGEERVVISLRKDSA